MKYMQILVLVSGLVLVKKAVLVKVVGIGITPKVKESVNAVISLTVKENRNVFRKKRQRR